MASDIFTPRDVKNLLARRRVLMIGDSNVRCLYKDLIYLLVQGGITPVHNFRGGGIDKSYNGDRVISISRNTPGRDYHETREFEGNNDLVIRYMFVTRVYSERVRQALEDIRNRRAPTPFIVIMNSFLWDLTRWGPMKEDQYKEDMVKLFKDMKHSLPEDTLVIWLSTLPVASERVKGGVFIQQVEFVRFSMRFWILEANKFAQHLCAAFNFNLLDLHYHMQYELHRRANDGLHWEPTAVRYMTNLILTHIALNLDEPIPGSFQSKSLEDVVRECVEGKQLEEVALEKDILQLIKKDDNEDKANVSKTSGRNIKVAKRRKRNCGQEKSHEYHMEERTINGPRQQQTSSKPGPSYYDNTYATSEDPDCQVVECRQPSSSRSKRPVGPIKLSNVNGCMPGRRNNSYGIERHVEPIQPLDLNLCLPGRQNANYQALGRQQAIYPYAFNNQWSFSPHMLQNNLNLNMWLNYAAKHFPGNR